MKLLGCLLVAFGAVGLCLLRQREETALLDWGAAMLADLSLLRREVCLCRTPLPRVMEAFLCSSPFTGCAWQSFLRGLDQGADSAWECFLVCVPSCFAPALMPLGAHLSGGGEGLKRAIDETREELASHLRRERAELAQRSKLRWAISSCAAALVILVLI